VAIGSIFAKAITCLESTLSTAGDVLLIWFGIAAELDRIFQGSEYSIPLHVKEEVFAIYNTRYNEIFHPTHTKKAEKAAKKAGMTLKTPGCSPHLACLYLNPGMSSASCCSFGSYLSSFSDARFGYL
jgi:hypothetical protein